MNMCVVQSEVAVSVYDRVKEFESEGLYASDQKTIMCKLCNCRVTWERKDSVLKHNKSEKHKAQKAADTPRKQQLSVSASFERSTKRKSESEFTGKRTVETFLKANIPLNKLDNENIREWMQEFMEGKHIFSFSTFIN